MTPLINGCRFFISAICFFLFCSFPYVNAQPIEIKVKTKSINTFAIGSKQTIFGKLEFVGGLEIHSQSPLLGAMSSIRYTNDGKGVIGVMDTGRFFTAKVGRDTNNQISTIDNFTIMPILNKNGKEVRQKWLVDAEGISLRGEDILVSFERQHKVTIFKRHGNMTPRAVGKIPTLIPLHEIRGNRGLETIATSPRASFLKGATIVVTEKSLNKNRDIYAAIIDGESRGVFYVKRHNPYDITDGVFLPNGDFLLLERRFNMASGLGIRIRRIEGSKIRKGNTVDGDVIFEADMSHQIDNMEGLDVFRTQSGETRLLLVSDDNHSFLQRNLLLEFRLIE